MKAGGLEIHWLQGSKAGKREGGREQGRREDEIEGKQGGEKGKLLREQVSSQQSSLRPNAPAEAQRSRENVSKMWGKEEVNETG